jgi:ligand-binding sensor domain-containing protein
MIQFISTYTGLQYWDGEKWVKKFEDTLSRKFIYTSFADGSGRFWFGTKQDGVLAITPSGKKVNYLHIPLSFNLVSNFFEDREKNIWIAGFRGLVKASPSPYRIITVTGVKKINSIRNCIALPTGKMLLSSDDGMLYIIDVSSKNMMAAHVVAGFRLAEQGDFIDHYCFDEKQRIWFTTREGALYRLDEQR